MTMANDIILTQKYRGSGIAKADLEIYLTATERQKSRQRLVFETGQVVHFKLPRGSHLHADDYYQDAEETILAQVRAKPEAVITVTATTPLALVRAAYHLGNRHVPLEVAPYYLRFTPDHVLEEMLTKLGLQLHPEVVPFFPEEGAYGHHH
ncbi:MAG: urease accessory protein UreE [Synechococcus sp.]|nr:urease accessory protein UreE [Synechococcus sp.]